MFQTRDWVDVYAGKATVADTNELMRFQTRDWVDVYAGHPDAIYCTVGDSVSNPRLG